jgi:MFS family permease
MVALVDVVAGLPIFLLSIPAGALADLADRRRVILLTQTWMAAAAATLAFFSFMGWLSADRLLLFISLLALGTALNGPAWQAIVPELVSRKDVPSAVALNSVGFNISRAVGPAIGGLLVASAGPTLAFLLNAVSYLGVIAVILSWKRMKPASTLPAEHYLSAARAGLRYVRHSEPFRAVLIRLGLFISCGSAFWALLPLVARKELGMGASGYGALLSTVGIGAMFGVVLLPKARRRISADALAAAATVVFAAGLFALASVRNLSLLFPVLLFSGLAWLAMLTGFNVAAQIALPDWVRARGLSVYLLVFFGASSAGGMIWGSVGNAFGLPAALSAAAVAMLLGLSGMRRFRLVSAEGLDLRPSMHWPSPQVAEEPETDGGPVLVTVEYRIEQHASKEFLGLMTRLRSSRFRDGALKWGVYEDLAEPGRFQEWFVVGSWGEHLQQHQRVTMEDRGIQEAIQRIHSGPTLPAIRHFIARRG